MASRARYLFTNLEQFRKRLVRKPSLFLDFDGTLAPIVARPEKAFMSYHMHELVRLLSKLYRVVIISGRGVEDVKGRVAIEGIVYAGNHGMEIVSPWFTMLYDSGRDIKRLLRELKERLHAVATDYGGAIVEDKGFTLSVHYRLVDIREAERLVSTVAAMVKPLEESGLVRVTEGKKVIEVRPPSLWHKGEAVRWLMERPPFKGTMPLYVGDDVTDVDAFRAIADEGVSISVGRVEPDAIFYLRSQQEVKRLLAYLKELAEQSLWG